MLTLIDSHNHLHDPRLDADRRAVIDAMKCEGIVHAIVNGTSESDWHNVQALHLSDPEFLSPAFGLHPWKIKNRSPEWLEKLQFYLQDPRTSIGECGLDLWVKEVDLADQVSVLKAHMKLSRATGKPLTIHCLKAWQELVALLDESAPLPDFLLHSFGGPPHLIKALCRKGAHFSFSGYFLHPRKHKSLQHFRLIPADRLLLETDAPDMAPPVAFQGPYANENFHHPADLPWCANQLAELREENAEILAATCTANARRLFSLK